MNEQDQPRDDEAKPGGEPAVTSESESGPLPLEEEQIEPCPNCGAPMHGEGLVCLRCGFNLETLEVHEVETGTEEIEPEIPPEPITRKGRGGLIAPAIVAIGGLLVILTGAALGWHGLYPTFDPELAKPIEAPERVREAARAIALVGIWSLGALGALVALAGLAARPLGDVRLAAARVLGIVVAVRLISLIDLGPAPLEITVEIILQAALFALLIVAAFAMGLRDALVTVAMTIIGVAGLWVIARIITTIGIA
jgi:hypothetical protein